MHRLKGDLRFSDFLTSYAFRCGRRRYLNSKNQLWVDLDSLVRAFAFSTPFTGTRQNLCCGSFRGKNADIFFNKRVASRQPLQLSPSLPGVALSVGKKPWQGGESSWGFSTFTFISFPTRQG